MAMIKKTAIVDPIPQSWVTRKCCSMAVPRVITRLPAISLVSINKDKDGIKTTWIPDFTPFNVNGKMTRRKVVHLEAPKSFAASSNDGLRLSKALKIGKIINGIKI